MEPFNKKRRVSHVNDKTHAEEEEKEDKYIPLHHLRSFGTSLRGGPVKFVPEKKAAVDANSSSSAAEDAAARGKRVADFYLDLVFDKKSSDQTSPSITGEQDLAKANPTAPAQTEATDNELFPTANENKDSLDDEETPVPLNVPYDLGPPSFDRRSKGFGQLVSRGFDPDTRRGLGAKGNEGRLYPVKAATNRKGNAGIGFESEKKRKREEAELSEKPPKEPEPEKKTPLNAKQMREVAARDKSANEDLEGDKSDLLRKYGL